eukprot:CAMPEP_0171198858 /NCGR_PEP_ID=MMETSP0790-20130122/23165_1 /TAXON_ID=2925 /ORGANISM="Alexandrium catenella, Strain OF101" /LENGTH=35 /DNA_ID= /DNA_START= /DNA_END= /DNA_ORIENTATION=
MQLSMAVVFLALAALLPLASADATFSRLAPGAKCD